MHARPRSIANDFKIPFFSLESGDLKFYLLGAWGLRSLRGVARARNLNAPTAPVKFMSAAYFLAHTRRAKTTQDRRHIAALRSE